MMSKVITFSRFFPAYHPRAGEPTYFVEKIHNSVLGDLGSVPFEIGEQLQLIETNSVKHHTIRSGHRWKAGDWFSPRVWSGKPYRSKMIQFAPDIQIKKVFSFSIGLAAIYIDQQRWIDKSFIEKIAANDGLTYDDFLKWFQYPKPFNGQIISWSDTINY